MNREIIFRGKRLGNGQWLYGDLMHDDHGGCYIYPFDAENLYAENKVNPDIKLGRMFTAEGCR